MVLLFAILLPGCSSPSAVSSPSAPEPTPPPSLSPVSIAWSLQLLNEDEASFGVRISLDGEEVYYRPSAQEDHHVAELERPYAEGSHRVEFEILRATKSPSVYRAAVTVEAKPAGSLAYFDGVPTALAVGDHLKLNVPVP